MNPISACWPYKAKCPAFSNERYDVSDITTVYFCTQEEKRLTEYTFGPMKPVTREEHIKIYQSTGIDVDGRLKNIAQMMPLIDKDTRCSIAFIKALPGFKSLPMEDKISVIKSKYHHLCSIPLYQFGTTIVHSIDDTPSSIRGSLGNLVFHSVNISTLPFHNHPVLEVDCGNSTLNIGIVYFTV